MAFIDNLNILRAAFPQLWKKFDIPQDVPQNGLIRSEKARSGVPTLVQVDGGQTVYLHSKYDPYKEAETLISGYENLEDYDQIIFLGVGMGYHIEVFNRLYPDKSIALYEPLQEVFFNYLHQGDLAKLPLKQTKLWDVEQDEGDRKSFIDLVLDQFTGQKIFLIILPSYQRIFTKLCMDFSKRLYKGLRNSTINTVVDLRFQKWLVQNSLINLKHTLKTPDLFLDVDKEYFKNRPALLVAAGPSLTDEIEVIRKIKESGAAYIFAASSSLSVLLDHDILPDAVCTYDPNPKNYLVIEPLVQSGITSVPVIYGTTVDHKTLEIYHGPKLHIRTTQDWIGEYLLKRENPEETLEFVQDGPTISIIVFQCLVKLGVNTILLVGQNLAPRDGRLYPKEIKYYEGVQAKDSSLTVEDVDGNQILTTESYEMMREALEWWIEAYPQIRVINTTRGGAKISGAEFCHLEDWLNAQQGERVVGDNWVPTAMPAYDRKYFLARVDSMKQALKEFITKIKALEQVLVKMKEARAARGREAQLLAPLFTKFDKAFNDVMKSPAHTYIFQPMNRVGFDLMRKKIREAGLEVDQITKADLVLEITSVYIAYCRQDWDGLLKLWQENVDSIKKTLN